MQTSYDSEGLHVQNAPLCYLCRAEGEVLYTNCEDCLFAVPGIWDLRRCPRCGLVWLNPQPVPEEIGKLYTRYHTHDIATLSSRSARLRWAIRDALLIRCLGYNPPVRSRVLKGVATVLSWIGPIRETAELSVMMLDRRDRGRLLDVGCGNGGFLAKMRELGWEVVGVEPDGQAVKVARERFGLSVHEGTLEEASFSDDTFDAITMNHVIEHVWDPIGTLQECRRLLKPGGKLVVVTPNIESLGHRLFKEAWRGLEVPRHLFLFSPYTLRKCAEQAGLRVVKLWTTARRARGLWVGSRLIRRNGVLLGSSPEKPGLSLSLEGLAFETVEHLLVLFGRSVGEALVLIASEKTDFG